MIVGMSQHTHELVYKTTHPRLLATVYTTRAQLHLYTTKFNTLLTQ